MHDQALHDRILARTAAMPSGCLIWLGYTEPNGYGRIGYNGKPRWVHRVAWMAKNGEIPKGLFICHKCDVPSCCNPEHLYAGTQRDNARDMIARMRHPSAFQKIKTHCKRGHELAGDNLIRSALPHRECKRCASITAARRAKRHA